MRSYLIQSNALKIPLADKKVHCAITSPPYYGLRDYSAPGQLGLEPTLQEYIDNTVLWAREIWRVLRDDGTFWLNLGDSYNGSGGAGGDYNPGGLKEGQPKYPGRNEIGLKPKDLMLVPHRVAIALQNDGWWVRMDNVWHKPNPMPESVRDRPTKSHEYIFLLTKSKKYYYDQDAIREAYSENSDMEYRQKLRAGRIYNPETPHQGQCMNFSIKAGRNKRSVWTITTKPYKGAHFATFPPEIPELCIKAGTSEKGVCPVCGSQWARVVNSKKDNRDFAREQDLRQSSDGSHRTIDGVVPSFAPPRNKTIGWKPACSHNEEPIPATVLDPFGGSGTTAMVAKQLGRIGICLDLSWEYLQLAKERCGKVEYQHSF